MVAFALDTDVLFAFLRTPSRMHAWEEIPGHSTETVYESDSDMVTSMATEGENQRRSAVPLGVSAV